MPADIPPAVVQEVITAANSDGTYFELQTQKNAAAADRDKILLRERSLLYVASTRARDVLAITRRGNPSTLLTANS